jgi:hypothetical protein
MTIKHDKVLPAHPLKIHETRPRRVPCSVLLTAGEREDEQDEARAIASQLPQGQSIRLPVMGHGAAAAASELLVPHARAFLDRCFN